MQLPPSIAIIHQPVRLRVMALLWRHGDIGFADAAKTLDVTPGNLDAHAQRLVAAGLMEQRRAIVVNRFEVRYRITAAGQTAFAAYLDAMEDFLQASRDAP